MERIQKILQEKGAGGVNKQSMLTSTIDSAGVMNKLYFHLVYSQRQLTDSTKKKIEKKD